MSVLLLAGINRRFQRACMSGFLLASLFFIFFQSANNASISSLIEQVKANEPLKCAT